MVAGSTTAEASKSEQSDRSNLVFEGWWAGWSVFMTTEDDGCPLFSRGCPARHAVELITMIAIEAAITANSFRIDHRRNPPIKRALMPAWFRNSISFFFFSISNCYSPGEWKYLRANHDFWLFLCEKKPSPRIANLKIGESRFGNTELRYSRSPAIKG